MQLLDRARQNVADPEDVSSDRGATGPSTPGVDGADGVAACPDAASGGSRDETPEAHVDR